MTPLVLGLRLARAGGWRRGLMVVLGTAGATTVVLVALAVVGSARPTTDTDGRRLAAIIAVSLLIPAVALLAAVTRLSAGVRDRRLAGLRILGISAVATRAAAAAESTVLAAGGVVLGAVGFLALRPSVARSATSWGQVTVAGSPGRSLSLGIAGWAVGLGGTLAAAAFIGFSPAREVTAVAVTVRRAGSARRPGWWRAVPVLLGTGLLVWNIATQYDVLDRPAPDGPAITTFMLGSALAGLGIPLVVPLLLRAGADLTVRRTSGSALIAARRLQQQPASATRLVAALLVGLFAIAGARCVLTTFEHADADYAREQAVVDGGSQRVDVLVPGRSPITPRDVRRFPDAAAVVTETDLGLRCDGRARGACSTAVVATCAQLPKLGFRVAACIDGQPAWIGRFGDLLPRAATVVSRERAGGRERIRTLPLAGLHRLRLAGPTNGGALPVGELLVPPGTPGLAALLPGATHTLHVTVTGGVDGEQAFAAAATAHRGVGVEPQTDLSDYDTVHGYFLLLWAVTALILAAGFLSMLLTGVDAAIERRRHVTALSTLGVPLRLLRRSQFLQVAAPVALGVPTAGGLGLLAGHAYLAMAGTSYGGRLVTPWRTDLSVVAIALGVGALVATATVAGLGGRIRPQDLRHE